MVESKLLGTLNCKEELGSDYKPKLEELVNDLHEAGITTESTSNNKESVTSMDVEVSDPNAQVVLKRKQRKRRGDETNGADALPCRRMPRRAAACLDFKEKENCILENDSVLDLKREPTVEEEIVAVNLTISHDISPSEFNASTRRLTDFMFHDVDGKLQPVEMLLISDLFITGLVLPFTPNVGEHNGIGVRCKCFGRIESWRISGYEDVSPVIWVSTTTADYQCIKPATSYRHVFSLLFEKAHACVQVYKRLSKYYGGDPDVGLYELLAAVVRSMKSSNSFSSGISIKDFVISQGHFIYNQLIGLDKISRKYDQKFSDLPVLIALQEESKKSMVSFPELAASSVNIRDVEYANKTNLLTFDAAEDEDAKLARILQEEEDWRSMNKRKGRKEHSSSSKYYIMMNEDEIAADYPLPAYYKSLIDETDEYTILDDTCMYNSDQLPRNMLHNWSLYNSDSRLVSLELLPMKPCGDIDFAIYGSGTMTEDDGSGFCLDDEAGQSSSAASDSADGIPVFLSEIKEWMIEFGASMVFISIRTDLAWYRLGKPSKQYAPWYETVLRTARLSIGIITLLKEQSRVAKLSVTEVIKRVAAFEKNNPAFISSNPTVVERYIVVHGQIILQQFAEYPDKTIRRCPFVTGLQMKMEERDHTKWLVKKKVVAKKGVNLNPRACMAPVMRKQLLPATTTRLVNRIWGEFYSKNSPEESKNSIISESKECEDEQDAGNSEEDIKEEEDDDDNDDGDDVPVSKTAKSLLTKTTNKLRVSGQEIKWIDERIPNTCGSEKLYKKANVHGNIVVVGGYVSVETADSDYAPIYYVEYMYEKSDGRKMGHGRLMIKGYETVLGNAANEREVFLTNDCLNFDLKEVIESVMVETRSLTWGYQHRRNVADIDEEQVKAEERKSKGLPLEYYVKSLYCPENGAFLALPSYAMGVGDGTCHACETKKVEKENKSFRMNSSCDSFMYMGTEYKLLDFVYVAPQQFVKDEAESETFKGGRNVGLKPYIICQLLRIDMPKNSRQVNPASVKLRVRRFFRPDDISVEKAYRSDIREVYYSEHKHVLTLSAIQGKCEVKKKHDIPSLGYPFVHEHAFFCEHLYDPDTGALKQLPATVKLSSSNGKSDDSASRKNKGKVKEGETESAIHEKEKFTDNKLATLDIFAGCGGLSEGLQQSGVSLTKWAIEYEVPAAEAFNLNHPETTMFINNCNVILRAIMSSGGDGVDCICTPEISELAEKLDDDIIRKLPRPGQVDFINGGPPCQGFSGMNRFNKSAWSKVQCEMILAFLSFVDYFRPKYFLLENVRNFISFNKGQTFRLTIASLLEMGYQVRFGILEAGAFGVSQSRKRAFIWAASPQETLPEWPEPMHVFAGSELKVTLDSTHHYAAVRSTATGAPFRSITVRDTIGDLPDVRNGAYITPMEYKYDPVSWYQKMIRADTLTLADHITKEMNELNLIRCQRIPKRPGADWRNLAEEKVRLSTGQMVDLVPWCLPNTAERHNQWKGLFGRLDWEGNFPTSITDPQPMGKVGMCFHPDQDRIVTVRECARSQGFPDGYKVAGNIQHKYRQIGNAVPPPLAFALGRKLKEVIDSRPAY